MLKSFPMSTLSEKKHLLKLSPETLVEYSLCLAEVDANKLWLHRIVNLIKDLFLAESVILKTNSDNMLISSGTHQPSVLFKVQTSFFTDADEKFVLEDNSLIFNMGIEGEIRVYFKSFPEPDLLEYYKLLLQGFSNSLKIRTKLLSVNSFSGTAQLISDIVLILSGTLSFNERINRISEKLSKYFLASRCLIRFLSQDTGLYNTQLSAEYADEAYLSSMSVIPSVEYEWLMNISKLDLTEMNDKAILNVLCEASSETDSLLAVKSIAAVPIVFSGKLIGTIVLHQCNFEKIWHQEEFSLLTLIAKLLSLSFTGEYKLHDELTLASMESKILTHDELLRELSRLQFSSRVSSLPFSLIMIEIEKFRDINLNMGFVASDLILSQLMQVLNRNLANTGKIARYNNEQFVLILENTDQASAALIAGKLKNVLGNFLVLGIGMIDFNFSYVTYPAHTVSVSGLLVLLEQGIILSKSRGTFQVSSIEEIKDQPKERWEQLLSSAIPEIILRKVGFKTGPDVLEIVNRQLEEQIKKKSYTADVLDSVQSLAIALDAKDSYTEGHSKRVSEYAYMLAKKLSLDLHEIELIRLAAFMHDIGKIGIPEGILCKNGKLTKEEFEVMKKHPAIGAKILKAIKPLEKVAELVLYHHEYWDGSGYPHGLIKEQIPVGSRIVSIVDAFQAMTSDRPYRPALPFDEAVSRLKAGKEKQWDPELVEELIKILSR